MNDYINFSGHRKEKGISISAAETKMAGGPGNFQFSVTNHEFIVYPGEG